MTTVITVSSGVVSSGLTISSGEQLVVVQGGEAVLTVVSSGGVEVVSSGGLASGTVLGDGGVEFVSNGAVASRTIVISGGAEDAFGGVDVAAVVSQGGKLRIWDGVASRTLVDSGGFMAVRKDAEAIGTVLRHGYEYDYWADFDTRIQSGGVEVVEPSALASGTVISSGGWEYVDAFSRLLSPIVSSGGHLSVANLGVLSGVLTLAGGTASFWGGAKGEVMFSGSSGLLIIGADAFGAQISGFGGAAGQRIEVHLGGADFGSSWSPTASGGTLSISGAWGRVAELTLVGAYTFSSFQLSDDGDGGVYITVASGSSPAPSLAPLRFAEAVAGLHAADGYEGVVHSGGSALMSAAPLVTAATSGR